MDSLIFEFFNEERNYRKILEQTKFIVYKQLGWTDDALAEDITQDLFLRLWKGRCKRAPSTVLEAKAYIRMATISQVIDYIRKASKMRTVSMEGQVSSIDVNLTEVVQSEERDEMVNGLISKREDLFTTQELKLWNCVRSDFSSDEICSVLNKDSSAVSKLRYKLQKKILRVFQNELKEFINR